MRQQNIRIIFGLKLKQLRHDNQLSLQALSRLAKVSPSYLNEIEKGKKYPKTEKIIALAEALGVDYDELVSLHLPHNLAPLGDLLSSDLITDLPLNMFGLNFGQMVDWMSNSPTKVGAFVGTIIEIARNYDMQKEHFYFAALRTYQQIHNNYFGEIEKGVQTFRKNALIDDGITIKSSSEILRQYYNYEIDQFSLIDFPELTANRYVLMQKAGKNHLLLNPLLSEGQQLFILCKEIGFNYLQLSIRPELSVMVEIHSFDHVLNNFKASYFAAALLLDEKLLVEELSAFFKREQWCADGFSHLISKYRVSAEVFFHRLTNILPQHFGLKDLFFLRLEHLEGSGRFDLTKELHLSKLHSPHAHESTGHYCRRWGGINLLKNQKITPTTSMIVDIERSHYLESDEVFISLISAKQNTYPNKSSSVTLGLKLSPLLKKTVLFWNDPAIQQKTVNQLCERCSLADCSQRANEPIWLQQQKGYQSIAKAVERLKIES